MSDSIEPNESRREAPKRLGSKMAVKPVTLYNRVKTSTPASTGRTPLAGSVEELKAQVAGLRKEVRELSRANEILQLASTFSGRNSAVNRVRDHVRDRAPCNVGGRADLSGARHERGVGSFTSESPVTGTRTRSRNPPQADHGTL